MNLNGRIAWIVTKNLAYATIVFFLWKVHFFTFLLVWLPFIISHYVDEMITYGLDVWLKFYAIYWITLAVMLGILAVLLIEFVWKLKRRNFMIGGEMEGKVVWAKGVRQGLIYDYWDLANFIKFKLFKKKFRPKDWEIASSDYDTETLNGTAPSPWRIPIGARTTKDYVIYVRRTWLPSIPERFIISKDTQVIPTPYTISIANVFIERARHPARPGRWDYRLGPVPFTDRVDTSNLTKKNRLLLHRAAEMVEIAVESDSETKKKDFEYGSFDVPTLKKDEGSFD